MFVILWCIDTLWCIHTHAPFVKHCSLLSPCDCRCNKVDSCSLTLCQLHLLQTFSSSYLIQSTIKTTKKVEWVIGPDHPADDDWRIYSSLWGHRKCKGSYCCIYWTNTPWTHIPLTLRHVFLDFGTTSAPLPEYLEKFYAETWGECANSTQKSPYSNMKSCPLINCLCLLHKLIKTRVML